MRIRDLYRAAAACIGMAAVSVASASPSSCDGNTLQIQQCLTAQISARDTKLAKYLAAAQRRIDSERHAKPDLSATQTAWEAYRKAHCGDIYEFWSQGTIRVVISATCQLRLAQERTHEIWEAYLTYPDSTPPLLPEPL